MIGCGSHSFRALEAIALLLHVQLRRRRTLEMRWATTSSP